MLKLPTLVTKVLSEEDTVAYDMEVRFFHTDPRIKPPEGEDWRIDEWYAKNVFKNTKYPVLSKFIQAVLSCFHGPQVEGSFNVMGDIISVKSTRVAPETYSAIQTVKYGLRATGKSAIEYFKRDDPKYDPVNLSLVRNMRTAYQTEKAIKEKAKAALEEKRRRMARKQQATASKRKAKELTMQAAKRTRIAHVKKLKVKK
jgi:hypothetical protein